MAYFGVRAPDFVYSSISLANDGGAVAIACGGAEMDRVAWNPAAGWPHAPGPHLIGTFFPPGTFFPSTPGPIVL